MLNMSDYPSKVLFQEILGSGGGVVTNSVICSCRALSFMSLAIGYCVLTFLVFFKHSFYNLNSFNALHFSNLCFVPFFFQVRCTYIVETRVWVTEFTILNSTCVQT